MAAATEWLGLHAVFGAFLFGAFLPRDDRLLDTLVERIEHVAVLVLMPVFFALAGLQHDDRRIFSGAGLPALLLILAAAVAGKILGAGGGARIAGLGWREAGAIGSLMNARGLMELIVDEGRLDAGVIDAEIFTMLMMMAVVTTLMTSPVLSFFLRSAPSQPPVDVISATRPDRSGRVSIRAGFRARIRQWCTMAVLQLGPDMSIAGVHDVVILGGGLAGLTLALQLRRRFADLDIVVVEPARASGTAGRA